MTWPSPRMPNILPRRSKTSSLEAWRHLEGLGFGGEDMAHWQMDVLSRRRLWPWGDGLYEWHGAFGGLTMYLQLQRLSPSVKTSPKGRTPSYFRVFFCAKVKFKMNCLILFCKGEILGLLTPFIVVYPKLCEQTMWMTFCINRDHKISF